MKTILVNPPSAFESKFVSREQCGIGLVEEHFLPSEIFLTASYLRETGHDVDAIDLDSGDLDFLPYQVAVVWVSVLHTFHKDISWLRQAKESGCRTVMILNEPYGEFEVQTLRRYPFIDAALRLWERELSLEALIKAWEKGNRPDYPGLIFRDKSGLVDTGLHAQRGDLSHLPSCAKLLQQQPLHKYEAVGITPGRGCTAGCRFCLYANTTQRKRRINDVIAEVEAITGFVKKIFLLDPDLSSTRQWTEAFCHEMIRRHIQIGWRADLRPEDADPHLLQLFRKSGCEELMVAVETLDPLISKRVGAGQMPEQLRTSIQVIRDAGIKPVLFFYIGLPWDNAKSLGRFQQFLQEVPISSFYLKQVRPWPGTRIYEDFKSLGLLKREFTMEDFVNSGSPMCPTLCLSEEDLEEWKKKIGRAGIFQIGYMWRFFKERRIRPKHVAQFISLLFGRNIFKGK